VDYTLTVGVSIAAGTAALTSAFPALSPATVPICLAVLAVITLLNLRGLGYAARAFLLPTMVFIAGLLAILAIGLLHPLAPHAAPLSRSLLPARAVEPVGLLLLLKAFSAGCSALTGVEAIANGFRCSSRPDRRPGHYRHPGRRLRRPGACHAGRRGARAFRGADGPRAGAVVVAAASPRDHELAHKLGAAVVVDQTAPGWPDQVRKVTDGGPEKVLACPASSLPGAARAARDDAIIATPVKAELPEADRIRWETYECQPSGSRLIRMAPRFDDGSLSVHMSAMYYWQDAAQAHRAVEQHDIPGEVVLIVDDDLAATPRGLTCPTRDVFPVRERLAGPG
jgi:hypothetical protein